MTNSVRERHHWISSASAWLTPRRIRVHAVVLAICLWGACVIDFSTSGIFDRAGNIKFQDFLQFSLNARLIAQRDSRDVYNDRALAEGIRQVAGRPTTVHLQYFYGPQVALLFVPLAHLSFLSAAAVWSALSLSLYFICIYALARTCGQLKSHSGIIAICAVAYPPFFHCFVRGHISVLLLLCFSAAALAFRAGKNALAGLALGLLVFKPQFLVGISLVLFMANSWTVLLAVVLSAAAQLGIAFLYFGPGVMRSYIEILLHSARNPASTELVLSPIQMHSLRSFWTLLIPWPPADLGLFVVCAVVVIGITVAVWKSASLSPVLRFSALLLAAVLVNPHIYIYDLLVLIPAQLFLADWSLENSRHPAVPALQCLLYLSVLIPLFGPLSRWTHLQLSVPVFAALLWILWEIPRTASETAGHKLASIESRVV